MQGRTAAQQKLRRADRIHGGKRGTRGEMRGEARGTREKSNTLTVTLFSVERGEDARETIDEERPKTQPQQVLQRSHAAKTRESTRSRDADEKGDKRTQKDTRYNRTFSTVSHVSSSHVSAPAILLQTIGAPLGPRSGWALLALLAGLCCFLLLLRWLIRSWAGCGGDFGGPCPGRNLQPASQPISQVEWAWAWACVVE